MFNRLHRDGGVAEAGAAHPFGEAVHVARMRGLSSRSVRTNTMPAPTSPGGSAVDLGAGEEATPSSSAGWEMVRCGRGTDNYPSTCRTFPSVGAVDGEEDLLRDVERRSGVEHALRRLAIQLFGVAEAASVSVSPVRR